MTAKIMVDWYEGDLINYFDDLVDEIEDKHDVKLTDPYLDTFDAIHVTDWKQVAGNWLGGLIDDLQSLLEEIEETPDCEDEEMELTIDD